MIKWIRPPPPHFCILQAIKNWTVGRPGNEAKLKVGQVNKFDIVVLVQGAVLKADEGIKVVLPPNCNNQWVDDTKSILAAKLTFEPL